jgi:hypothetical protein
LKKGGKKVRLQPSIFSHFFSFLKKGKKMAKKVTKAIASNFHPFLAGTFHF